MATVSAGVPEQLLTHKVEPSDQRMKEKEDHHDWAVYYINTHLDKSPYLLNPTSEKPSLPKHHRRSRTRSREIRVASKSPIPNTTEQRLEQARIVESGQFKPWDEHAPFGNKEASEHFDDKESLNFDNQYYTDESDIDEGDEQGAAWEEWTNEQRNQWLRAQAKGLLPAIREAYTIPTAGRISFDDDITMYEGFAGIAYLFLHLFCRLDSSLPLRLSNEFHIGISTSETDTQNADSACANNDNYQQQRTVSSESSEEEAKVHSEEINDSRESTEKAMEAVRQSRSQPSTDDISQEKRTSLAGLPINIVLPNPNQQIRAQQQFSIALLQTSLDYIEHCQKVFLVQHDDSEEHKRDRVKRRRRKLQQIEAVSGGIDGTPSPAMRHTENIEEKLESDDMYLDLKHASYIMTESGIWSLAACIYHHRIRYLAIYPTMPQTSPQFDIDYSIQQREMALRSLTSLWNRIEKQESKGCSIDSELLYGKAGYLFSVLQAYTHLSKQIGRPLRSPSALVQCQSDERCEDDKVDAANILKISSLQKQLDDLYSVIEKVFHHLVGLGQKGKLSQFGCPLSYEWHGKWYYGAAHGIIGVLYTLLQAPRQLLTEDVMKLITETAAFLLKQRYPSGNLPSSYGATRDKYIQWCHGATALCLFLVKLHEITGDKIWLDEAEATGEVIWHRGLIKKGVGLCHGISGNAYCFLALYKVTKQIVHLRRAQHFAHFSLSTQHRKRLLQQPDVPMSLMNGAAGCICFLNDCEYAERLTAIFPAFDILA